MIRSNRSFERMSTQMSALPATVESGAFSRLSNFDHETLVGKVLLMGGSDDPRADCYHSAMGSFVSLAGGRRARIVVLTQASQNAQTEANDFALVLRKLGAKRVDVEPLPTAGAGQLPIGSPVPRATGFLFVGDDPRDILACLADSVLLASIRSRHQHGAVV